MLNYVKLKKKRKKDIIFYVNAIRERDRFLIKENKVKKKKKKKANSNGGMRFSDVWKF